MIQRHFVKDDGKIFQTLEFLYRVLPTHFFPGKAVQYLLTHQWYIEPVFVLKSYTYRRSTNLQLKIVQYAPVLFHQWYRFEDILCLQNNHSGLFHLPVTGIVFSLAFLLLTKK